MNRACAQGVGLDGLAGVELRRQHRQKERMLPRPISPQALPAAATWNPTYYYYHYYYHYYCY